jgi:hypothetical protein
MCRGDWGSRASPGHHLTFTHRSQRQYATIFKSAYWEVAWRSVLLFWHTLDHGKVDVALFVGELAAVNREQNGVVPPVAI